MKITVTDLNSHVLLERDQFFEAGTGQTTIDLHNIPDGMYFIHIGTASNPSLEVQKFIVIQ